MGVRKAHSTGECHACACWCDNSLGAFDGSNLHARAPANGEDAPGDLPLAIPPGTSWSPSPAEFRRCAEFTVASQVSKHQAFPTIHMRRSTFQGPPRLSRADHYSPMHEHVRSTARV